MFCPNCGTEATDGQRFCANCGAQLPIVTRPAVAEPDVVDASAPVEAVASGDPVAPMEVGNTPEPEPVVVAPIAIPVPAAADDAAAAEDAARTLVTPVSVAETTLLPQAVPAPQQAYAQADPYAQPYRQVDAYGPAGAPVPPAAQQAVPPAPAKKPWYDTAGFKVAIAAVVIAAVLRAGLGALGLFGHHGSGTDAHDPEVTEVVTEASPDDGAADGQDSGETDATADGTDEGTDTTPEDTAPQPADGDYLNDKGYPTLLAFMELNGAELANLVESNRYIYHEDDDAGFYAKRDGTIVFNMVTTEGSLDKAGIKALSTGGHDEAAVYVTVLEGYGSVSEVLDGIAGCVIEDVKNVDDLELIALVHGPSMEEYLVNVYDVEDGDYEIDLYTPESVEMGFFDIVNDGTFGDTPAEAFRNYG